MIKAAAFTTVTSVTSFQALKSQLEHSRKRLAAREDSELGSHRSLRLRCQPAVGAVSALFSLPSCSMTIKPKGPNGSSDECLTVTVTADTRPAISMSRPKTSHPNRTETALESKKGSLHHGNRSAFAVPCLSSTHDLDHCPFGQET